MQITSFPCETVLVSFVDAFSFMLTRMSYCLFILLISACKAVIVFIYDISTACLCIVDSIVFKFDSKLAIFSSEAFSKISDLNTLLVTICSKELNFWLRVVFFCRDSLSVSWNTLATFEYKKKLLFFFNSIIRNWPFFLYTFKALVYFFLEILLDNFVFFD